MYAYIYIYIYIYIYTCIGRRRGRRGHRLLAAFGIPGGRRSAPGRPLRHGEDRSGHRPDRGEGVMIIVLTIILLMLTLMLMLILILILILILALILIRILF